MEKVPHVHGNSSLLIRELIDVTAGRGLWGCEKSCTARNFPGFEVFGTNDKGEVWNGPRSASSCARVKGPMYLPAANLLVMMDVYTSVRSLIEL